jgi:hypothetical protein
MEQAIEGNARAIAEKVKMRESNKAFCLILSRLPSPLPKGATDNHLNLMAVTPRHKTFPGEHGNG